MTFKRLCFGRQKAMFWAPKGHVLKVKRWSFEKDYDYDWKRYTQLILYLLIHYTLFLPSYWSGIHILISLPYLVDMKKIYYNSAICICFTVKVNKNHLYFKINTMKNTTEVCRRLETWSLQRDIYYFTFSNFNLICTGVNMPLLICGLLLL